MTYKIITEKEVVTTEVTEVEVSLQEYIGIQVKNRRVAADMNMAQLSRALERRGTPISSSHIWNIEKGVVDVKVGTLITLANYFGAPLKEFIPEL